MACKTETSHLTLRNEISEISRLEPFLKEFAPGAGLGEADIKALNLALEEAVTNIVRYAYPVGREGSVGLDACVTDTEIRFTLTDGGIPFDPTERPDPDVTLGVEDRPIGGLGIYMVRKIMDEVRYERKGAMNVLTMIKKR